MLLLLLLINGIHRQDITTATNITTLPQQNTGRGAPAAAAVSCYRRIDAQPYRPTTTEHHHRGSFPPCLFNARDSS
uniref:Putative secreted protein n=1 Tax=Anopheles triannulatus TaxID=58253 RepID=A0A2M4B3C7_9DIPT